MPRKKRSRAAVRRRVIEEPVLLEPEDDEQDPFKVALQEFGDDAGITLHVYRYDPMTGKPRYAKSLPFSKELHGLDWLQRMFGSGDYLLRFYDAEGNSRNRSVSIDDDPQARKAETPAPAPSSASRDELVTILREQNNLILSALLKGGGGSSPAPASESPAMLKVLEALLGSALAPKPDISATLFSVLERGMSIAMEAKADSEGGIAGIIRSAARELAPVIGEYARARMTAPPAPPMPFRAPANMQTAIPPAFPAPAPEPTMGVPSPTPASSPVNGGTAPAATTIAVPPSPGALAPETMTGDQMARAVVEGVVRFGVEIVERAWREQEKPSDVADWILGEVPANYYEQLGGLTVESVATINPRYAGIDRAWLEQVLARVREEVSNLDGEERSGGDAENS